MSAKILDGKAAAAAIKAELRERVDSLGQRGITAGFGAILVGDDLGSTWNVASSAEPTAS